MKIIKKTVGLAFIVLFGFTTTHVYSETYSKDVMLHGAIELSKISGFRGTTFELQDRDKDHAIFGFMSRERRNQECSMMIRTENINDSTDDSGGAVKDFCGGAGKSQNMNVEYVNGGLFESRVFVRAIRVCVNKKGTRIKGLQIRGRKVTDDGKPIDLTVDEPIPFFYGHPVFDPTEPSAVRANCNKNEWKQWAECPRHSQIAMGALVHFKAGAEPRALTGIELQCRHVGLVYVPIEDR